VTALWRCFGAQQANTLAVEVAEEVKLVTDSQQFAVNDFVLRPSDAPTL